LRRELTIIYDEYAAGLLRYARSVAGNSDVAGDAVQEAFFRYFVYRREGNVVQNERAWLFRVTRNVLYDRAKSPACRHTVQLDQAAAVLDPRADLEHDFDMSSLTERLPSLLSARELECVRLRAEGLRYDEIGAALNLQSGTVGALLTRAVTKLRRTLRGSE
jgi:RNA polymerase sigma-70 factor (ECF subfamily)